MLLRRGLHPSRHASPTPPPLEGPQSHLTQPTARVPEPRELGCLGHAEPHLHPDEGENKVLVLETNYWMYVIFYLRNIQNGIETRVLALYGRVSMVGMGVSPHGPRAGQGPPRLATGWSFST